MASITVVPIVVKRPAEDNLRVQLEELLFDFYSVVGVAPRRPYPVVAADLLTDNFQGRFFISATSELMYFTKAQMLASKVGRGDAQSPASELVSMNLVQAADGTVSVSYAASFCYGQTAMIRRGTLKAVETPHGWALRSVDEDVRVIILADIRRKLCVTADRPRIWIS